VLERWILEDELPGTAIHTSAGFSVSDRGSGARTGRQTTPLGDSFDASARGMILRERCAGVDVKSPSGFQQFAPLDKLLEIDSRKR